MKKLLLITFICILLLSGVQSIPDPDTKFNEGICGVLIKDKIVSSSHINSDCKCPDNKEKELVLINGAIKLTCVIK